MEKKFDVFISYSRKDYLMDDEKTPAPDKIVSKILNVLDVNNISYWIDKQGLYSSAQFAAVIEEQISAARCFLFVSTQASNASKYTLGEVFTAVEYEKPIIPFRADDSKFGKGIGFHLRPLDHIEYFKIGEEAFVKLVASINHIKAEQLHEQLFTEYKNIVTEYKIKLSAKTEEMKSLGINPPVDYFSEEGAIREINKELERKIEEYKTENTDLKSQVSSLTFSMKRIEETAVDTRKDLEIEIETLKSQNNSLICEKEVLNGHLSTKDKQYAIYKHSIENEKQLLEIELYSTKTKLEEVCTKLKEYQDKESDKKLGISVFETTIKPNDTRNRREMNKKDFKVGNIMFSMIPVEGGVFDMGDGSDTHKVSLSNFMCSETLVTQGLWKNVMEPLGFIVEKRNENLPMTQVSWDDCQLFLERLNKKTERHFRLLTEAEWEFAARGGNMSENFEYAGSNDINEIAWYDGNSNNTLHKVKGKKPNELGLYDMLGNVWEWCQDWYSLFETTKGTECDPQGPDKGKSKILRGGGYDSSYIQCNLFNRINHRRNKTAKNIGFRIALSE